MSPAEQILPVRLLLLSPRGTGLAVPECRQTGPLLLSVLEMLRINAKLLTLNPNEFIIASYSLLSACGDGRAIPSPRAIKLRFS